MIRLDLPLIGPAVVALASCRAVSEITTHGTAVLLHGSPGVAKSHILDVLALELSQSKFAVEHHNGQSVSVDLVRQWRERAAYGNLFSDWTIKRVDELDKASTAAQAELLTWLDYLPAKTAILASTNDYGSLRASSKGRLETRFKVFRVDAPSIECAVDHLRSHYKLPAAVARSIAAGAVPDGCLPMEGVNMRACIEDAESFIAVNGTPKSGKIIPMRKGEAA